MALAASALSAAPARASTLRRDSPLRTSSSARGSLAAPIPGGTPRTVVVRRCRTRRVPRALPVPDDGGDVIDGGAPIVPVPQDGPVYRPYLTEGPPPPRPRSSEPPLPDGARLDDGAGPDVGSSGSDPLIVPGADACLVPVPGKAHRPIVYQTRPLPSVLVLHTGGTLGMSSRALEAREDLEGAPTVFKEGTGGDYTKTLQPGKLLVNLVTVVPELRTFANLEVKVVFNKDSCQIGPKEWVAIAKELDAQRARFDAFVVIHGTDTMAYTASALSLMLAGFRKPIILTGSQLPLDMPRSDARQNLIDAVTCATAGFSPPHVAIEEVAVCFGGKLLRANRTRKTSATIYSAFGSPQYPPLAQLGVGVEWKRDALLQNGGNGYGGGGSKTYTPRLKLNPNVLRVPIVPGCDPNKAYGDLYERGVRGIVLEAFGVGNMPLSDPDSDAGWIPWLRKQRERGMMIYLTSQCESGDMHPELYATGSLAIEMGAESGPMMTPECAVVKLMLCLAYPNLPLTVPLAGEL